MTQHTMNLLLGFILGWCLRGVYAAIKKSITRKLRNARLAKASARYETFINETAEGRELTKIAQELDQFELDNLK